MTTKRMSTTKLERHQPEMIDEDGFTLVTKKRAARGIPPNYKQIKMSQSVEDEDEDEDNDKGNKEEDEEKQ
jgi:hypothetical protein